MLKFEVSKSDLQNAITKLEKVRSDKSKVLNGYQINLDKGILNLTATDLNNDNVIVSEVDTISVLEEDVNIYELQEISNLKKAIKNLDNIITFNFNTSCCEVSDSKKTVRLQCGTLDGFDYYVIKPENKITDYLIQETELLQVISKTIYAVATKNTSPTLQSIYFNSKDIVACDGYTLQLTNSTTNFVKPFLLNLEAANILKSILDKKSIEGIYINLYDNAIEILAKDFYLQTRLIEGLYLNYKDFFETEGNNAIEFNRAEALENINFMLDFMTDKDGVLLEFKENEATFSSNKSNCKMDCNVKSGSDKIRFDAKKLALVLKNIGSGSTTMSFNNSTSAAIFTNAENTDKTLLMPIR